MADRVTDARKLCQWGVYGSSLYVGGLTALCADKANWDGVTLLLASIAIAAPYVMFVLVPLLIAMHLLEGGSDA